MQIYECILSLLAGVGVFILSMKLLSDSLKELAGDKMKSLLQKLTGNRIKGVLMGAFATAVIQCSAATTIMVIGFVNANVMNLFQAASVVVGANIGTTVTGLLASLESLNISLYLSLLVFIGVMLSFIKKLVKIANLLKGLGMIFVGLKLMSLSCNDDSIKSAFSYAFETISFPLLLEFLGLLFTALIQSSSAMTGIVIVMISNDALNLRSALFIILGANIGSCITSIIGSIGANLNSKRVAVIHLSFNIFGCVLFTPIIWIFNDTVIYILESIVSKGGMQIAFFHLIFNCSTALIITPFIKYLVKFSQFIIKEKENKEKLESLINNFDDLNEVIRSETSTNSVQGKNKGLSDEKSEGIDLIQINEKREENNIEICQINRNVYGNDFTNRKIETNEADLENQKKVIL